MLCKALIKIEILVQQEGGKYADAINLQTPSTTAMSLARDIFHLHSINSQDLWKILWSQGYHLVQGGIFYSLCGHRARNKKWEPRAHNINQVPTDTFYKQW